MNRPVLHRCLGAIALLAALHLRADPSSDLGQLTRSVTALASEAPPGCVLPLGRYAFPLASAANSQLAPAAAAYYRDDPRLGRCVVLAHTRLYEGADAERSPFLGNVLRWLGQKDQPDIRCGPGTPLAPCKAAGLSARHTGGPALADDLAKADVVVLNLHTDFGEDEWELIRQFSTRGGGLLLYATPNELDAELRASGVRTLAEYGLALGEQTLPAGPYSVAAPYHPFDSGFNAVMALNQERVSGAPLPEAYRRRAASCLERILTSGSELGLFQKPMDQLSKAYGLILISPTNRLDRTEQPVESLLALHQGRALAALPADDTPPHPSASDWPGACAPGVAVKQTVTIQAYGPRDRFVNRGALGVTRNTGLYAMPGKPITVTLPERAVGGGLALRIGIHTDELANRTNWLRCPIVTRTASLTSRVTRLSCAFGGLVQILVPPGCALGQLELTIEGAVPAPAYRCGIDPIAAWPALRAQPGAWGYVESDNFCVYASRRQLHTVEDPDAVGTHWERVIALCDETLGYKGARQRGEAVLSDVQLSAPPHRADYPMMLEYGDGDTLLRGVLRDGDWACYHRLGLAYLDAFDGELGVVPRSEVEANLTPALLMSLLHGRSPWDGDVHESFDAETRLAARQALAALPPAQHTWAQASATPAGMDFYCNLGEAFGWPIFGRAFQHLLNLARDPAAEPLLASLDARDPAYRRHRLLLLLSRESGYNLEPFFASYGLGSDPALSPPPVLAQLKKLPAWGGNRPPSSLSMPDTITVDENATPGSLLYAFTAQDPDAGNRFAYRLVRGNEDGALSLDPQSGEMRVVDVDFERAADYLLAVEVTDLAVPRFGLTNYFEVAVNDLDEVPTMDTQVFEASSRMAAGTPLGSLVISTEDGRAVGAVELVNPEPAGAFALSAAGPRLHLSDPTRLPTGGVLQLSIVATDSSGRKGMGQAYVLANERGGLRMERWNGHDLAAPPAVVGLIDDPSIQASAGSQFTRRLSGWLVPPRSGSYSFWTCGDDSVQLFLSTDDQPARKKRIAFNRSATKRLSWDERPSQRSQPIQLRAGRLYYVEILHRENEGEDHLAIAWEGPAFAREPLPRRVLLPHR